MSSKDFLSPSELVTKPGVKVSRLNRRAIIIAIIVVCSIGFILLATLSKEQEQNIASLQKIPINPKLEPTPVISVMANVKPADNKNAELFIPTLNKDKKPTPEEESSKKLKEQELEENLKARTATTLVNGFVSDTKHKDETSVTTTSALSKTASIAPTADNYLSAERTAALSAYELKAGSVIPAVMISGINSDLPGNIIAQVQNNIYDTRTGNYLLIPQGAKLFGRYDSQIAYGQNRVLIAWDRIIFPDSSSITLAGMAGSDSAGYAGFGDQVNNHYARIFGSAILMSFLEAGAQLSQPQNTTTNAAPTASQVIGASVGAQLAQTGNQLIQKNLSIQPTIEIRPGYTFNVMVNKDIIFPGIYSPMPQSGGQK